MGPKESETVISLVDSRSMKEWAANSSKESDIRTGTPTGVWFFAKNICRSYGELNSKGVKITKPEKQAWGGVLCTIYDQGENSFGLVGDSEDDEH